LDKIKAGVDIIQFDEPAFNVFFDEVNDWGVATLERALEGLKCETAVHICYGYGIKTNTDWKNFGFSVVSIRRDLPEIAKIEDRYRIFRVSKFPCADGFN